MYLHEKFLRNRVEAMETCLSGFVKTGEIVTEPFAVYPNPANGILFVETQSIASLPDQTYRITNLMGQTLLSGNIINENQQINISNLPEGTYFIRIETEQENVIRKIVKIK